jgi:hypothetical protein
MKSIETFSLILSCVNPPTHLGEVTCHLSKKSKSKEKGKKSKRKAKVKQNKTKTKIVSFGRNERQCYYGH